MSDIDLNKLEALARAAESESPGQWRLIAADPAVVLALIERTRVAEAAELAVQARLISENERAELLLKRLREAEESLRLLEDDPYRGGSPW